MKLKNIAKLHCNMLSQGLTKTKYDFRFRTLLFSVIYIAEEFPHELLFGCHSHNLFFVVKVEDNYNIIAYMECYKELVKALGLRWDPLHPFKPTIFFEEFDDATPLVTTPINIPTMLDIAICSRDVEDAMKIYFFGWKNHLNESRPSKDNLTKTHRICGRATFNICKKYKISSRWTDDPKNANKYHEPNI